METIVEALERFNEYMRAKFFEWYINFLKRRMEKMKIERETKDLKASKARSTCEEFEEYARVQAEINKDAVTKFEAMEKILENLDGKVTEIGSSIREVFIMMKMLEMQVGQLAGRPMGSKGRLSGQYQGPEKAKATQTHSEEMEDHTRRPQRSRLKDWSLRCRATT
jgi:hypothetical protein